jgi:uncharacterized protein YjbJ (UPF0337 family)
MSSPSKTDAKKDQFVGDVKSTMGSAVGNESLEAKGQTQHNSGLVEETTANVAGYVQGAVNTVSGVVSGAVGALTGNTSQEATGKAEEKKGEAKKSQNS